MADATAVPAAATPASTPAPSGPNMSVIKGPCKRVSSLGVVLRSAAFFTGCAFGLDYILKASDNRSKVEHARRKEFESILGEIRAARQEKFEQARPAPPATSDIWALDFSKSENVKKLLDTFSKSPGGGKH